MEAWLPTLLPGIVAFIVGAMSMNASTWSRTSRMKNNAEVFARITEAIATKNAADNEVWKDATEVEEAMRKLQSAIKKDAEATLRAVTGREDFWIAVGVSVIALLGFGGMCVWALVTQYQEVFISCLVGALLMAIIFPPIIVSQWGKYRRGRSIGTPRPRS